MENWVRSIWFSFATWAVGLLVVILIFGAVVPAAGLRCFQCGQYTDGPGSITPCTNYTVQQHLKECPPELNNHCIKYVNEGSTVRECAHECHEKRSDSWGTSIYCCQEDSCNSGPRLIPTRLLWLALPLIDDFRRFLIDCSH